jgi:choline dehydrogenase-like flavoprotein
MKSPLGGPFGAPRDGRHFLGSLQTVEREMKRFADRHEVDVVVVGVGSAGGVLVQRLARAGFDVVGLEAGPFWDTERDWVSDEVGSHKLYWTAPRVTGGKNPIALGANNSGHGVGGGSVHWAGFTPRFHPSDFHVLRDDGVGADWPLTYEDLKPYYEILEREIPVSGPLHFPWGDPHGYTYGPHPSAEVTNVLVRGCTSLGIRAVAGGPVAINAGAHGDRPHCIYRGFCIQGCKVGAKQSTLVSHVPDAIDHGAEIRARSMASRIAIESGRVTGVHYIDEAGQEHFQRARLVIVSGYAIETPRLLLNSACESFKDGLANSSGTLGRYLMVQGGNVVMGRFPGLVRMYKGPPANGLTEEFYETDARRGFVRGFAVQTVGPLPISFAKMMMVAKGAWGWGMRRVMMDYNHWAPLGLLGELLPWEDNRVTLADEVDRFGLRVAKVHYDLHDNDRQLIRYGVAKVEEILRAAGAEEVVQEPRFAHLVGGARMGKDPQTSVVDAFGGAHDVPNLFVCDGSMLPTQGSANPGLTIQSLAARTADYLIHNARDIFAGSKRPSEPAPVRRDLCPPATKGRGIPRFE